MFVFLAAMFNILKQTAILRRASHVLQEPISDPKVFRTRQQSFGNFWDKLLDKKRGFFYSTIRDLLRRKKCLNSK